MSKFIVDAALKAFADFAKEKWGVQVRTNAQFAGTPVSYGRIVEWKGKPQADIFWGGESALFDKLAEQKLLARHEVPEGDRRTRFRPVRQAQGDPAQGSRRVLGRDGARALRAGLPPAAASGGSGVPAPRGLGGSSPPEAQGLRRPVRADPLLFEPRDLRDHPPESGRSAGAGTGSSVSPPTRASSPPGAATCPSVVAKGEFAAGFAVPSYMAFEEVLAGFDVKFVAPKNAFVTPEPMAILTGAKHPRAARAFIEFLLTERGQRVFMERGLFPHHAEVQGPGPAGLGRREGRRVHGRGALLLRGARPANVYDDDIAQKRYQDVNERYRREIEAVWDQLKK